MVRLCKLLNYIILHILPICHVSIFRLKSVTILKIEHNILWLLD